MKTTKKKISIHLNTCKRRKENKQCVFHRMVYVKVVKQNRKLLFPLIKNDNHTPLR